MPEILSKISATVKRRRGLLASVVLLAAAGVAGFMIWGNKAAASDYITAKVERGNVRGGLDGGTRLRRQRLEIAGQLGEIHRCADGIGRTAPSNDRAPETSDRAPAELDLGPR